MAKSSNAATSSTTSSKGGRKPTKAQLAMQAKQLEAQAQESVSSEIPEEQHIADEIANQQLLEAPQASNNVMDFAVQQMSTPSVDTNEDNIKNFQKDLEALKLKHGMVNSKVSFKAPPAAKDVRNNITRPGSGTKCGLIWSTADSISKEMNGVCTISQLRAHPAIKPINDHTIKTQYARWRAYNGIKGLLPKISNNGHTPFVASFGIYEKF